MLEALQKAHAAARAAITSARYGASVQALASWLDGCEWRAGGDAEALLRPIGELAPILLSRCHRQAKKRGKLFDQQSDEERHRLRIALKKLRYTAELLSNLHEPAKTVEFCSIVSLSLITNVLSCRWASIFGSKLVPPRNSPWVAR
jgi:CHAD domain-containing protein